MEKNSHQELTVLERQKLRKSMGDLKAGASDILFCVSQLKIVEAYNEKRSQELEFKEKELQNLSSDIDKKVKDFEKEKSEAGDLKKLVEECTQELRSKKNELTTKLDYSTKIQREIELKKKQLGSFTAQLQKLYSEAGKVQDETDRKKKELSLILDQIQESKNQFVTVDEELNSARRQLEVRSSELQSLNNQVTDCGEEIDSKSKHLGKIQKLIEQQTSELGSMQNQCDSVKLLIQERSEELVAKERRLKEFFEAISRSSFEMAKEITAAETQVSDLNVKSEMLRQEVEGKEKELHLLRNEIESEVENSIQVRREMEEDTNRKKKDLVLILSKIEESGKKLAALDEQVESQQTLLEETDRKKKVMEEETDRKKKDLSLILDQIKESKNQITVCGQEIESKSKESGEFQKLIEQQTIELGATQNQCDSVKLLIQQRSEELVAKEKRHNEILEAVCRSSSEMEERAQEVKAAETKASDLNVKSEMFRQEVEGKEKELMQLKREMEEITDIKKDLSLILDQTKESSKQLAALDEQVESQRRLLEKCVVESRKGFRFDLEVKEKRLQALNKLITISDERLGLKSKELVEIQRQVELHKRLKRNMINALVKRGKQPPIDDDTSQQDHGISASLTHHEVYSVLRVLPNPAEYVLELVQDDISEGSGSLHDSFAEILVLLFEELAKIQRPDKSQLQLKAEKVAALWKGKITIEAPTSSLEALAFLLFIVAYNLQKVLITEGETALLASSIAQYEQAPTLFSALGLKLEIISEIVLGLIKQQQYISAVRLICVFELNKDFQASLLLREEIKNLRRSALGMRPTESSQPQAKDEDGRRLRAILELVADYKLKIKLPGDLIAKLMVQRENSTPLVRCTTSSANPQADSPNPAAQLSSLTLPVMSSDVDSKNERPSLIFTYQRRCN
ncbi:unnamed protein product [Microthlaspi erraticum]|uniref:FRIGIDA-like protein n=1 Tax=Microthlaspi erraticum TaxID=1685480 RepID=A0A6D2JVH8_9BRAS|nr:unnamed protein product [Microthlaspi erraticum]